MAAADPRFFPRSGPHGLGAVVAACGGRPPSDGGGDRLFSGIASLAEAGPGDVSFFESPRYLSALRATRAGAVLVPEARAADVPAGALAVVVQSPPLAFARVAALFHAPPAPRPGVHPTAVVAPDAALGPGVEIGPHAVVGARAEIGEGSVVGPHAVVGEGVVLGPRCRLHAHASISHAVCGAGVVLHPGARVGQEGFGFVPGPDGSFVTMPQLGRVVLGDGVEIGANSCVDRGALGDTVLGPGTRLDNLVQVGHNCVTGRGCVLVSQVGVSGSTTFGDFVTVGGQAGFAGHLRIGSGARIGAQTGVISDLPPGAEVMGTPALPAREFFRAVATTRRLAEKGRGDKPRQDT